MVVKSPPIVPYHEDQSGGPIRTVHDAIDLLHGPIFSVCDRKWRMIASPYRRGDPAHLRQLPLGQIAAKLLATDIVRALTPGPQIVVVTAEVEDVPAVTGLGRIDSPRNSRCIDDVAHGRHREAWGLIIYSPGRRVYGFHDRSLGRRVTTPTKYPRDIGDVDSIA